MYRKPTSTNLIPGILSGLIAYLIIGKLGLFLLQTWWSDYALHIIDKSYTLEMLVARLFVAIVAAIIAGVTATKVANDRGRSAWFVAVIIFCAGSYIHFMRVWLDYPVWYHFAFLVPIIPVIALSHHIFANKRPINE